MVFTTADSLRDAINATDATIREAVRNGDLLAVLTRLQRGVLSAIFRSDHGSLFPGGFAEPYFMFECCGEWLMAIKYGTVDKFVAKQQEALKRFEEKYGIGRPQESATGPEAEAGPSGNRAGSAPEEIRTESAPVPEAGPSASKTAVPSSLGPQKIAAGTSAAVEDEDGLERDTRDSRKEVEEGVPKGKGKERETRKEVEKGVPKGKGKERETGKEVEQGVPKGQGKDMPRPRPRQGGKGSLRFMTAKRWPVPSLRAVIVKRRAAPIPRVAPNMDRHSSGEPMEVDEGDNDEEDDSEDVEERREKKKRVRAPRQRLQAVPIDKYYIAKCHRCERLGYTCQAQTTQAHRSNRACYPCGKAKVACKGNKGPLDDSPGPAAGSSAPQTMGATGSLAQESNKRKAVDTADGEALRRKKRRAQSRSAYVARSAPKSRPDKKGKKKATNADLDRWDAERQANGKLEARISALERELAKRESIDSRYEKFETQLRKVEAALGWLEDRLDRADNDVDECKGKCTEQHDYTDRKVYEWMQRVHQVESWLTDLSKKWVDEETSEEEDGREEEQRRLAHSASQSGSFLRDLPLTPTGGMVASGSQAITAPPHSATTQSAPTPSAPTQSAPTPSAPPPSAPAPSAPTQSAPTPNPTVVVIPATPQSAPPLPQHQPVLPLPALPTSVPANVGDATSAEASASASALGPSSASQGPPSLPSMPPSPPWEMGVSTSVPEQSALGHGSGPDQPMPPCPPCPIPDPNEVQCDSSAPAPRPPPSNMQLGVVDERPSASSIQGNGRGRGRALTPGPLRRSPRLASPAPSAGVSDLPMDVDQE